MTGAGIVHQHPQSAELFGEVIDGVAGIRTRQILAGDVAASSALLDGGAGVRSPGLVGVERDADVVPVGGEELRGRPAHAGVCTGHDGESVVCGDGHARRVPIERERHTGEMRLLLLADTHVPARARSLPPAVWDEVDRADVVVHAGDWVGVGLLDQLEGRARRLVACWGNNDGPALRERLPEIARVTLEGVRLAVVHETGAAAGREKRAEAAYPDTDVLVFGHSHIPWDTTAPGGLRLLNPGSPTDRRRQPHCTYMTATALGGVLNEVELHRLPVRSVGPSGR